MLLGGLWHGAGWTFVLWGALHGIYLVINHGWRRLFGSEGESSGWHEVMGIGLTFASVVIAWVPFRSPDMDTALRMWAGMFCLNGISLPTSLATRLPEWLTEDSVIDGLAPLSALSTWEVTLMLLFGLAIIWLLPNSQQWMAKHQPAWDDVSPQSRFVWFFTNKYAIVGGVLFAITLLMLTRESAFLYSQF